MAGDVIGCCIDLDEGTISYSRLVFIETMRTSIYNTLTAKW